MKNNFFSSVDEQMSPKPAKKKTSQIRSFSVSHKMREWQNIIITERNQLTDMKYHIIQQKKKYTAKQIEI